MKIYREHTEELKSFNLEQKERLNRKLVKLCNDSKWAEAGRREIITNLSSRVLSDNEVQALSLGLKFDTGKDRCTLAEHVMRNYKYHDSEAQKGFVQGILMGYKAMANNEPNALPRRFIRAIENLSKDKSIIVLSADKGGGVIVMDQKDYDEKMQNLLDDSETYRKERTGYVKARSEEFNKKARKLLRKSNKGRKLQYLLEEAPSSPKMRGLPKVHKAGIPMRPITSGLGSAPHRIAKCLAKPLTQLLGTLNDSHLKNSGDLLNRLKDVDFEQKKLASFDVKALFTSVPVKDAMVAIRESIQNVAPNNFPIPKSHFLELVELCLNFQAFTFHDDEYSQIHGLAMGSPLSPVAACLFMEMMERDHFLDIMGEESIWYRYIDDVLIVVPRDLDLDDKLSRLNEVHNKIQFTLEKEQDGSLSFLDIHINRTTDGVKYKVYRKSSNKEDYIHYFSAHSKRTKSGVVIGFFLRAMRICSNENLKEEYDHIVHIFLQLKYPKAFIVDCFNKAKRIKTRTNHINQETPKKDMIVVPRSKYSETISKAVKRTGLQVIEKSGQKIGSIVAPKLSKCRNEESLVYKIPCGGCKYPYYGETSRGLKKRTTEHKRDLRNHNVNNSLVKHIESCPNLPNWKEAEVLKSGLSKSQRKLLESSLIESMKCTNSKAGDIKLARSVAKFLVEEHLGNIVT